MKQSRHDEIITHMIGLYRELIISTFRIELTSIMHMNRTNGRINSLYNKRRKKTTKSKLQISGFDLWKKFEWS